MNYLQLLLGVFLGILIAFFAWRAHTLSRGGAIAAAIEGSIIFGLGGLDWAILLLIFFITSSGLSFAFKRRKHSLAEKYSKGSQRDASQVLANGGLAAFFVLLHTILPESNWVWVAFTASLAAVNADTWATELGVLSPAQPRLITTWEKIPMGTSGGVTLLGSLASLTGAASVGLFGALFLDKSLLIPLTAIFAIAGLFGSFFDSLLGATVQAIYTCPTCNKETERHPIHLCGSPTTLIRGFHWLNNDLVNFGCSLFGVLVALLLWFNIPGLAAKADQDLLIDTGENTMKIQLSSPAFAAGEFIPKKYTCDGENKSPALRWDEPPTDTKSFVLIFDDPDAPMGTFVHWVLYDIPPTARSLPEGVAKIPSLIGIGTQGINSYRKTGYDGPCPPRGSTHRYNFKIYALKSMLDLPAGMSAEKVEQMMEGRVLAQGSFVGKYGR